MRGVAQSVRDCNGVMILDGGSITAVKLLGADIYHKLWQAYFIKKDPELIKRVHREFFQNGAQIAISCTYNASVEGLMAEMQLTRKEARELLAKGIELAEDTKISDNNLVAASCGPFGSFANEGLEYSGIYKEGTKVGQILEGHRERFEVFCDDTNCDIVAFETIPNLLEVEAILDLVKSRPSSKCWIAVACKSEEELVSGETVKDFVQLVIDKDPLKQVEAIGVNCSKPELTGAILKTMRGMTSRVLIAYPNAGGEFNPHTKGWDVSGSFDTPENFAKSAREWVRIAHPVIVGGCCRTDNKWIKAVSDELNMVCTPVKGKNNSRL